MLNLPWEDGAEVSRMLFRDIDPKLEAKAGRRIDDLLNDPTGLPNGKHRRTMLASIDAHKLKSALIDAVEHAAVFAKHGPLPNHVKGRGRPPDNAVFIFIDDIVRAYEKAGLKPGLRYVEGSESLPVRLYIELAPLLWPPTKNPRRLFQRWQRYRSDLIRIEE